MRGTRDNLHSMFLRPIRRGAALVLLMQIGLGQIGFGQPGPTTVPAIAPDTALRGRLQLLAPPPGIQVQVMQPEIEISVLDFQKRVRDSGGDLKVLAYILGQADKGLKPTYDERLGIARDEFQRYLIFRNTLKQSSRSIRLNITRSGNRLTFGDTAGASILKGLSIDLNSGDLTTQDGFSARPTMVQASAAKDITGMGASNGVAWDVKGSKPSNALQGHLSLLQFAGGQILLSYQRVAIINSRFTEGNINLLYRK